MKFIADENYPPSLISYLQKHLHDVKRVQRSLKGISDQSLVVKAKKENRILLTFDKDLLRFQEIKVIIFDFPEFSIKDVLSGMDKFIVDLKRFNKRKAYTLIFSRDGLLLRNQ